MGKSTETSDRARSSDWALHVTPEDVRELAAGADDVLDAAALVLDGNWVGASTVPSKGLYPHQWSWDSAFIAIGNAWERQAHAQLELETLFAGQWRSGMLPHIVFDPSVPEAAYFPGSAFWQTESAAAAPRSPRTSGITQPPIHARAALEIHRHARDGEGSRAFLSRLYPALVAQHDYLARARDPRGSGLAAIVHPWESGLDNSPVWDHDLALLRIPVGSLPDFDRRDLQQAAAADRPTDAAYRRYLFLVTLFRDAKYDDAAIVESSPFLIADPLFNAIYLWSTLALIEIASVVGADPAPHREAAERIHRGIVEQLWVQDAQRFCPWDLRRDEREPQDTIVSFAPLLDPDLPDEMVGAICAELESPDFHAVEVGTHYVVPSDGVRSTDFDRRRYWRGPVWLNTNWLLWAGLRQHGRHGLADEIFASSVALVRGSGFREYFDPFSGEGHGSQDFSWSAALAIDMVRTMRAEGRRPRAARLGR